MPAIIECVPNFSEGRDLSVIESITREIESVDGVKLLHVDPGKATHRTVVSFVGEPAAVVEAAFLAIRRAGELIDMRHHTGEHPRMGATDVCPLVPVSGISLEETAVWAQRLAERVGRELSIPVYLYAAAQRNPDRRQLSVIRAGEYEGFAEKITQPGWTPDFGPAVYDLRRGATVIGARDFLVAYNINLNSTSVRRANSVAFDVREAGRVKRAGDPVNGKILRDAGGRALTIPGTLRSVQAIGWYIGEYGFAQVSMNLTDLSVTPLHKAFDEVCEKATARGMRVTGSELVGLIPLQAMLQAGKYFLEKQKRSAGVSEKELIRIAVRSLGLDELRPFKPEEQIIEYRMADPSADKMIRSSLSDFADAAASEQPAPGGGAVAAYLGALGAALGAMVANLSARKKGWENRWQEFSDWAAQAQRSKEALIKMVDADSHAFELVMQARAHPKATEAEQAARTRAIQEATAEAIRVPFQVMKLALSSMQVLKAMAAGGNPHSASDAGVGALCARSAVLGAALNIRINTREPEMKKEYAAILEETEKMEAEAVLMEREILSIADGHRPA